MIQNENNLPKEYDFIIFQDGSFCRTRDSKGNEWDASQDIGVCLNAILPVLINGGVIVIKSGQYHQSTSVTIPYDLIFIRADNAQITFTTNISGAYQINGEYFTFYGPVFNLNGTSTTVFQLNSASCYIEKIRGWNNGNISTGSKFMTINQTSAGMAIYNSAVRNINIQDFDQVFNRIKSSNLHVSHCVFNDFNQVFAGTNTGSPSVVFVDQCVIASGTNVTNTSDGTKYFIQQSRIAAVTVQASGTDTLTLTNCITN